MTLVVDTINLANKMEGALFLPAFQTSPDLNPVQPNSIRPQLTLPALRQSPTIPSSWRMEASSPAHSTGQEPVLAKELQHREALMFHPHQSIDHLKSHLLKNGLHQLWSPPQRATLLNSGNSIRYPDKDLPSFPKTGQQMISLGFPSS